MTPEKETELFLKLDTLIDMARRTSERVDHLSERVSRVEGRIEEQSKFLQLALAGRQSRRSAAE
jgi:hypothetical protein